jgi:hypothetical protein
MARVAHPNVLAVHDVGRVGDQVFIAMELVDGETLQAWLRTPRSFAEIVDVFARAGGGLAAAHSAELVHRDFKPNNVMIDRGGRVRVMDFGLARSSGARDPSAAAPPARADEALTATGVILGTPAYMAPEQLAREPADARTDQFSFCVSLYEALAGTRPFVAADTDELRAAMADGRLARPTRKVPAWLLRVVERGLRAKPDERWPSMDALVEALGRDPRRLRRRALAAAAALCVLAGGGVAYRRAAHARDQLCTGGARALASAWDPARRTAVARAFAATGLPYADRVLASVNASLDGYGAEWVAAHDDACRATRLRGEQSEEMLDLRMACLDDQLGRLASLADVLARADGDVVENAASAAAALPPVAGCADLERLRQRVRPPRDPAERAPPRDPAERA